MGTKTSGAHKEGGASVRDGEWTRPGGQVHTRAMRSPPASGSTGPTAERPSRRDARLVRDLLRLFLLALLLRAAAWALVRDSRAVAEESVLSNEAVLGATAVVFPAEHQRAPGVMIMYRVIAATLGRDARILRAANAVLGALLIPVFLLWVRRLVPYPVARLAALVLALDPELVFFSVTLWSEALYLVLMFAALGFFESVRTRGSLVAALAAGALLGMAGLTREVGLFLAAFLAIPLVGSVRPGRWRPAGCAVLLLVSCGLVVLPWSLTISRRAGYPVVVTDMMLERLYIGNAPVPGARGEPSVGSRLARLTPKYRELAATPQARKATSLRVVGEAVWEGLPWWPVRKTYVGLRQMLGLNSFPAYRLLGHPEDPGMVGDWAFRFSSNRIDRHVVGDILGWTTIVIHALLLVGGVAGIALGTLRGAGAVTVPLVAAHLLPPIVTLACSRYRVPVIPLLAIGAASLFLEGRRRWREASPSQRSATGMAVVVAAALLAFSAPYLLPLQYG